MHIKSSKGVLVFIIMIVLMMMTLDNFQDKIINIIGDEVYIKISIVLILIFVLLIVIFCMVSKKGREVVFESFLLVVLFIFISIIFGLFFISFVGELTVVINNKYDLGKGNWLSYFGAVFGAGVTVGGAYFVSHLQSKDDNKNKIKTNSILLLNDLKYINSRINEYVELIKQNNDNQNFYRIRYLDISENWRELVSYLHQNKVIENDDVTMLYNFFTDIYFISEKYSELQELNINELTIETQQKEGLRKRKKQIKEAVNNKYIDIHNVERINDIIEKLNKRL